MIARAFGARLTGWRGIWTDAYVFLMRFSELEVGRQYALVRGGRPRRVTILDTPEEVRRRGLVRVRNEDGVTRGQVVDQQLRFITSRWGETAEPKRARRVPPVATRPGPWPPEPGDRVIWPDGTADIEWTVEAIDLEKGTANIVGTLFSLEKRLTAPLLELEPLAIEIHGVPEEEEEEEEEVPETVRVEDDADRDRSRPEKDERRPVERAVDRLEFSESCLRQYQEGFEPRVPWLEIGKRLRRELKNQGRIIRRRRGEYLRIRTRRFDVSVTAVPSDTDPFLVRELIPLPSHMKRKTRRKRRPRR
jgi:hypothetical protein